MKALVFDRVTIASDDGTRRSYSAQEFLALPLHERVRYILGRDVAFFLGSIPVERGTALRALRE